MLRRARGRSPALPPGVNSRSGSISKRRRSSRPAIGSICFICRNIGSGAAARCKFRYASRSQQHVARKSTADDNIMVFRGRFREHILPEQIHILNVSFLVPELRREFGGCAGNIAYNLKLLGADPLMMATVGDDALLYLERLERLDIEQDCVRQVPDTLTAQAF